MFPFWQIFLLIGCYLLGAIPWGAWIARRHGVDITQQGSGNTGAANALRTLGWKVGGQVLLLDVCKGTLAVWLAEISLLPSLLLPLTRISFGLAAILGHNYSVFRRFKGGKGVATSFGVLLALSPKVAMLALLLWISLVALTRFSSVGSLGACAAAPILMIVYGDPWVYVLFAFLAAALVFHRHKDNLERLSHGQEHTIDRN